MGSLSAAFLTWSDSPVSDDSSIFKSFPWIKTPSAGRRSPVTKITELLSVEHLCAFMCETPINSRFRKVGRSISIIAHSNFHGCWFFSRNENTVIGICLIDEGGLHKLEVYLWLLNHEKVFTLNNGQVSQKLVPSSYMCKLYTVRKLNPVFVMLVSELL